MHSLWIDYLSVQFDAAHLLAELGFSIVFELVQLVVVVFLWRRIIKPRLVKDVHKQIDSEHGVDH